MPLMVFCTIYLRSVNDNNQREYALQRQYWLTQNAMRLTARLEAISNIVNVLQFNTDFLDYLQSEDSLVEMACNYMVNIRPLLVHQASADSHVFDLYVHQRQERLSQFLGHFRSLEFEQEKYRRGVWTLENGPEHVHSYRANDIVPWLLYRKNLYSKSYREWIGVIEVRVQTSIVLDYMSFDMAKDEPYMLVFPDGTIYCEGSNEEQPFDEERLSLLTADRSSQGCYITDSRRGLVNAIYLQELGCFYICWESENTTFHLSILSLIPILFALLGLFTLFYFLIIGTLMTRLDVFASKLRGMNVDELEELWEDKFRDDEIGYLYASYNYLIARIRQLVTDVRQEERLREAATYAAMQSKIQPHFLYGTLETIRMIAIQNDDEPVASLTYLFSKLMRYSLGRSDQVKLGEELEYCREYLAVQKTRLGDKLTYNFDVSDGVSEIMCPRFILQPVIENSIHHGLTHALSCGNIYVSVMESDGTVRINVRDNGIGIPTEELERIRQSLEKDDRPVESCAASNGFALRNVHRRLRYFYGDPYGVHIESIEGLGTSVTIIIAREERGRSC